MSVSAITVTGLNSISFTRLNLGQQIIIFLLQTIGSSACVSLITIVIRLHFFRVKFKHLARAKVVTDDTVINTPTDARSNFSKRLLLPIKYAQQKFESWNTSTERISTPVKSMFQKSQSNAKKKPETVSADMIKRVDEPVRINKMNNGGFISENGSVTNESKVQQASNAQTSASESLETAVNGEASSGESSTPKQDENVLVVPTLAEDEVRPKKTHVRRASWNVGPRQAPESPLNVRRFQTLGNFLLCNIYMY